MKSTRPLPGSAKYMDDLAKGINAAVKKLPSPPRLPQLDQARADARLAHATATAMLTRESAPSTPPEDPKAVILRGIAKLRQENGGSLPGDMGMVLELCENYLKRF